VPEEKEKQRRQVFFHSIWITVIVADPGVVACESGLAAGFEGPQQRGKRRIFVFTNKVNRSALSLSIHI